MDIAIAIDIDIDIGISEVPEKNLGRQNNYYFHTYCCFVIGVSYTFYI